jgi:ribonuclease VapC
MFLDASALVAIMVPEPDGDEIAARLEVADRVVVSPLVIWESVVAMARIRRSPVEVAQHSVDNFLIGVGAEIMPIDAAVGDAAIVAFARFGKGRHPAALNMGDCFAYACARSRGLPMLCKGDDFAQTDALLA